MITSSNPLLQVNPPIMLHNQILSVEFQVGKREVVEALQPHLNASNSHVSEAFLSLVFGFTKYPRRGFRLIKTKPGRKAKLEFRYHACNVPDVRVDLGTMLFSLLLHNEFRRKIAFFFALGSFYPQYVLAVAYASYLRIASRMRCRLIRFEVYGLIPRAEYDMVRERLRFLATLPNRPSWDGKRVTLDRGMVDLGGSQVEVNAYFINQPQYPQDSVKVEFGCDVPKGVAAADLIFNAASEFVRLFSGLHPLDKPQYYSGVRLAGGRYVHHDREVTWELRDGFKRLAQVRQRLVNGAVSSNPIGLLTGNEHLDALFDGQLERPGVYRLIGHHDGLYFLAVDVARAFLAAGKRVAWVSESCPPPMASRFLEVQLTSFEYAGNNKALRVGAVGSLKEILSATESRPSCIVVELFSAPQGAFWRRLHEAAVTAGVVVWLIHHDGEFDGEHDLVRFHVREEIPAIDIVDVPFHDLASRLRLSIPTNKVTGRRAVAWREESKSVHRLSGETEITFAEMQSLVSGKAVWRGGIILRDRPSEGFSNNLCTIPHEIDF